MSDPLHAACTEFYRLRAAELGATPEVAPKRLAPWNAAELFRRAEAFGYSGGYYYAEKGQIQESHGYGMAKRSTELRITPDTIFDIGSVAKQFTAAAVLRLEEMGRLRTSDRISTFFSDVPAEKRDITIHHLLTHSAGLPARVGEPLDLVSREQAVRDILSAPLLTAPGQKYAYSNLGFTLLAALVEQKSGMEFETFLRRELWQPAGLSRTGIDLSRVRGAPVAESYTFDGVLPPTLYHISGWEGRPSWRLMGSGFMFSTLTDMGKWAEALRKGQVLTDASRFKLFRPHVREDDIQPSYYGYGWAISGSADGSCRIGHNGSAGHQFDVISFFPERDAVYIAYTSMQRSPWANFPNNGYSALLGNSVALPAVASRSSDELAVWAGDYRAPDGSILPLRLQAGRLNIEVLNGRTMRLFSPWKMLSAEETALLGDRQALVSAVMGGIAKGDYRPLMARLRPEVDQAGEREWWQARWPLWLRERGSYLGTDLVGTVKLESTARFPIAPEDRLRSLAVVRFERGSALMGFVHDPKGKIYVDWMQAPVMRHIYLAPAQDGRFVTYSPVTGRTVKVDLERRGEQRTMRINNGQEMAVAVALHR